VWKGFKAKLIYEALFLALFPHNKMSITRQIVLGIMYAFLGMAIINLAKSMAVFNWPGIAFGIVGLMPPALFIILIEKEII